MLTGSQHKTLSFIRDYMGAHGYSPSLSDIAKGLGLRSRGVVHRNVHALAEAGFIELVPGRQRNIQLKEKHAQGSVPFLGQIAAGRPIEAIEDKEQVDVSQELTGENRYALKVKGESMLDAGILDGDIVIIRSQQTAQNGDIVVALVDQSEATLKRFKRIDNEHIQLTPENTEMEPMTYHQSRVDIQGVLVGQFRTYN